MMSKASYHENLSRHSGYSSPTYKPLGYSSGSSYSSSRHSYITPSYESQNRPLRIGGGSSYSNYLTNSYSQHNFHSRPPPSSDYLTSSYLDSSKYISGGGYGIGRSSAAYTPLQRSSSTSNYRSLSVDRYGGSSLALEGSRFGGKEPKYVTSVYESTRRTPRVYDDDSAVDMNGDHRSAGGNDTDSGGSSNDSLRGSRSGTLPRRVHFSSNISYNDEKWMEEQSNKLFRRVNLNSSTRASLQTSSILKDKHEAPYTRSSSMDQSGISGFDSTSSCHVPSPVPPPPPPPPQSNGVGETAASNWLRQQNINPAAPVQEVASLSASLRGGESLLKRSERFRNRINSNGNRSRAVAGGCTGSSIVKDNERNDNFIEDDGNMNDFGNGSGSQQGISKEKRCGLTGLKNLGNTVFYPLKSSTTTINVFQCFMSCIIQCLSNTKPLREYLLKQDYRNDLNSSTSRLKGALVKAFAELIEELWSDENSNSYINPDRFKNQIQKFAPRFTGYSQQDAQEFLRYLLQGLHEDVNRVKVKPKALALLDDSLPDVQKAAESWKRYLRLDDSRIVDLFVGQLKSELKCTHCQHVSTTFDPFWDLSLPIPDKSRHNSVQLLDCFDSFMKEETLDGDEKPTCERCKTRRRCTKIFSIYRFPTILVLHLKRFSGDRYRSRLSTLVEFPTQKLDLSRFSSPKSSEKPLYDLYGVSNHSGTPSFGHYTAYGKHAPSSQWVLYDDTRTSVVSEKSVISSEAYVLFFELNGGLLTARL